MPTIRVLTPTARRCGRGRYRLTWAAPGPRDRRARETGGDDDGWRATDPRGLPDGLPGHVQLGGHRARRPRRASGRRSRSPLHARRPVQQAQRLRRVHAVPRATPLSDAAHRPEGRRRLRADLLGGGARRDRRAAEGRHPRARRGGHLAVRGVGQHGAPPGRLRRRASALERRRRLPAPHDDLHDRGRGGHRVHPRRQPRRHGSRDAPLLEAHHPLGQQHADDQPASLALHHHGAPERRPSGGHRPDPDPHGRRSGQPSGARPRNRRRAGARPPARRPERGRGGLATSSSATRSAGTPSAGASSSTRRLASPRSAACRSTRSWSWGSGSPTRAPPASG